MTLQLYESNTHMCVFVFVCVYVHVRAVSTMGYTLLSHLISRSPLSHCDTGTNCISHSRTFSSFPLQTNFPLYLCPVKQHSIQSITLYNESLLTCITSYLAGLVSY